MNKEMIKALIDDGWRWIYKNEDTRVFVLRGEKPNLYLTKSSPQNISTVKSQIPSCLCRGLIGANTPIELKTLLLDDDEDWEAISSKELFDYINNLTIGGVKLHHMTKIQLLQKIEFYAENKQLTAKQK